MRNAIILHGNGDKEEYYSADYPSASNSHWLPWLQKQLLINDISAQTPEMPHSYAPDYAVWSRELERYDIGPETILVGHSSGAGFLVRWLSEHKDVNVGKVILVAPWLDPNREDKTDFFDFKIDHHLGSRTKGLTILSSDNDTDDVKESVRIIALSVSRNTHTLLHGQGHFVGEEFRTKGFPELLEEILK